MGRTLEKVRPTSRSPVGLALYRPWGRGSKRLYFASLFVDGDYRKLKFLPKTFPYIVSRICILVTGDSVRHASMLREITMRWIWLAPS